MTIPASLVTTIKPGAKLGGNRRAGRVGNNQGSAVVDNERPGEIGGKRIAAVHLRHGGVPSAIFNDKLRELGTRKEISSRLVKVIHGDSQFPLAQPWWEALAKTGYVKQLFVATIWPTDGSQGDVAAKIAGAASGDIVEVPAGTFNWTTGVSIGSVSLRGAGAGGIIARSVTSTTIGTGSKVFTVVIDPWQTFTAGQSVIVHAMHNGDEFQMIGTVTSLVGDQLTINVTSTVDTGPGGSTWAAWCFRIAAQTTILHDGSALLLAISPTTTVDVSGIYFKEGTAIGNTAQFIEITEDSGFARIRDCQFSTHAGMLRSISVRTNHGLIYHNSFDCGLYSGTGAGPQTAFDDGAIVAHPDAWTPTSWNTPSTMGTADTDGLRNFYIEANRFTGVFLQAMDFDGNSRIVFRTNILDNSACTSHGQDTSASGLRHFEFNDNIGYRDIMGAAGLYTYAMSYFLFVRGGTFVITGNVLPDLDSQQWGSKAELVFTVFNIRLAPSQHLSCQLTYPASRQIGRGYIDGSGPSMTPPVGTGNLNIANAFMGDLEPGYVWGNSGGATFSPGWSDATDSCGNGLVSSDFALPDRDYYLDTPKPGYAKYADPHPLRTGSAPDLDPDPSGDEASVTLFRWITRDEQDREIYEALGGDGSCWFGMSREERRQALYEAAGGTEQCFLGRSREEQEKLFYEALYASASSTENLVDPSCFNGLSPELKEYNIFAAASLMT